MQICAELINKVTIKKIDFYNLLAIHVHIFTLFGAKDDLLFFVSLLRRKIAYVMLTSIPWECLNSLMGGSDEFGKH